MATEKEIKNMTNSIERNGWNEWAKYVLMSLEELKNQLGESEDKIDKNKDSFIQAINNLELTVAKEMVTLRSDLTVMKTRFAARTMMWSSIVPGIVGGIMLLLKFLG